MTRHPTRESLIAIFYVTLGFFMFSIFDLTIKLLSARYGIFQLMFFAGLGGTAMLLALGKVTGGPDAFRIRSPKLQLIRGCLLIGVNGLNLYALRHIQMAEFYAIAFLSPLLITALCAVFLNDPVGPRRWAAITTGFMAVLYMLRPGGDMLNLGGLAVLCSVFLFSINMMIIRKMGRNESRFVNALVGNIAIALFASLWVSPEFTTPRSIADILLFLLLGVCNSTGSLFLQLGFQVSPSSAIVAPFHYSQIIWGVLFGYVFFGDIPSASVLAGSAVLILTGLYIIRSERPAFRSA